MLLLQNKYLTKRPAVSYQDTAPAARTAACLALGRPPGYRCGSLALPSRLHPFSLSLKRNMDMKDWPTLGEMIDSGRRLVVFMDYGADQNQVDYILDEFTYFWETPFSQTDTTFAQRSVHRGKKSIVATEPFLNRLAQNSMGPVFDSRSMHFF